MTTPRLYLCLYRRQKRQKLVKRITLEVMCGTEITKFYYIKIEGHKLMQLPKNIFMRGRAPVCSFCKNQLVCLTNAVQIMLQPDDIPQAKKVILE